MSRFQIMRREWSEYVHCTTVGACWNKAWLGSTTCIKKHELNFSTSSDCAHIWTWKMSLSQAIRSVVLIVVRASLARWCVGGKQKFLHIKYKCKTHQYDCLLKWKAFGRTSCHVWLGGKRGIHELQLLVSCWFLSLFQRQKFRQWTGSEFLKCA